MPLDVVRVFLSLFRMNGVFGNLDVRLAGECFEGDPCFWKKRSSSIYKMLLPLGKVPSDVNNWGGKDHGVAETTAVDCICVGVHHDKRTHAFAAPYDAGLRMLLSD